MEHQNDTPSSPETRSSTAQRRPYRGSCHCGTIAYVVFLKLPAPSLINSEPPASRGVQRIYKCNCTVCHKAGFFHVRPASAFDDFVLLSPSDPFEELGDYLCNGKKLHFFFCKKCGGSCFIFNGEGETVNFNLGGLDMGGTETTIEGETVRAWRPKKTGDAAVAAQNTYLSVNAHTIDAGQEGFDMREWVENKSVHYLDWLRDDNPRDRSSWERPHPGGTY